MQIINWLCNVEQEDSFYTVALFEQIPLERNRTYDCKIVFLSFLKKIVQGNYVISETLRVLFVLSLKLT